MVYLMKVFVVRRPVFNRNEKVVAYKLLFRAGPASAYDAAEAEEDVIRILAKTKQVFIQFPLAMLKMEDFITYLPRQTVIVEIADAAEKDSGIVEICQKLKRQGYAIALTASAFFNNLSELNNLVDVVKVNFLENDCDERQWIARHMKNTQIRLMAEKVETRQDFAQAAALGYIYIQGGFFCELKESSILDLTERRQYLRILQDIYQPGFSYKRMEETVTGNDTFSSQLLKYANRARLDVHARIHSIKHALIILGKKEVEKWLSILILQEMSRNITDEILLILLTRARFGELLVEQTNFPHYARDAFVLGLFSLLDCILQLSWDEILIEFPLPLDVKNALLGRDNQISVFYYLVVSYENGRWNQFSYYTEKGQVNEAAVHDVYLQALQWAEESLTMLHS